MRNPFELRDDLKRNDDEENDPFGRVRPNAMPDKEIADLSEPNKLSAPVGEQGQNQRRDVAKTELLLGHAGTLDLKQTKGPTGYWGERTREATRSFQKQNELKVDGQINPGGETIRALAKVAGAALGQMLNATPSSRHPVMTTTEASSPQRHSRESGNPALNTLGKMDPGLRRDDGLHGNDGSVQAYAHTPPLPDETISSNQRLATALSKRRGIGDLHRFTTDAINTDPAKAIPEIADLLHRVHAGDPAQAQDLFHQTLQGITPEHRQALQQAVQRHGQGNGRNQDGIDIDTDQGSEADFKAQPAYPVSANFGSREQASVQAGQKTPPPDPGQDDPDEPTEPKDPGQDDPEDPCAVYETAVADAEANVEALKAHADELERELVDLAKLVNEKEHQQLQIEDTLLGLGVNFEGAKYHPSSILFLFNNATGQTEEEYKRKRENLQNDLNVLSDEVKKMRDKMHESRKERQAMNGRIAYARGQLAQAKANLRRCEQG